MNIRLTIQTLLLVAGLSASLAVVALPAPASAVTCPPGTTPTGQVNVPCACPPGQQLITQAVDSSGSHCVPINNTGDLNSNPIFVYLKAILRFMAAGIGLAVAGGIIFGGYMYMTARANAGQIEKAKVVIINSVVGLFLFIFMYAILQFIIPGGIFT